MGTLGQGSLTAVSLPPPQAAAAILTEWSARRAVLPLDPRAPASERARVLAANRPTHVFDAEGRHALPGGDPVDEAVAAVVTTSGTTGGPKAVELTWSGLRASAHGVSTALGTDPADRWLCCLPLHGVGGLAIVARAWTSGLSLDVAPRFELAALAASPATLVSLVPTTLARALDAGVDLARFRRVLVGGAALDDALRRRAEMAGAPVVTTYGLTETWGGVVHDGHPLAGAELRVGDGGEILVRGSMVMKGYRLRPQDTAAVLSADGWLRTGDLGDWSTDGRLRVVDRLGDLIVTGGVNVSPSEVEGVLGRHPGVADVCVTGTPDAEWGERVVAHVVPTDPADPPSLATLRAFTAESLSPPNLPRELVLVDAIPRTPGGKPLRRLLTSEGRRRQ